ncbi:MAG TPA: GMC family oxidoreductase [Steroidobacteraceae bacterium]|nr:GMC family oxidoreductase [Steroidobacteraceae bacterium]
MSASEPSSGKYDAIVVGSGISGGWAAKELTEKGLNTLLLEAGPPIVPERDYAEHVQAYSLPYRGYGNLRKLRRDQPIQSQTGDCDEWVSKWFVNDRENPYHNDADKPFLWIRGRHVGGRSLMWGRQVYRWSDLDFEANAREGIGVDWPIRYADIAPWYSHVEKFIGVSGQAEGLAQLPDGEFLPPMQLNCAEQHVREAIAKRWGRERVLTIGRAAILTQPHLGRAACHYCGPCWRGCITHSYFNSIGSTLPAAAATGRLTLRPNSVVAEVLYDARANRASGVRAVDADTLETLEFRARVVFLCASALESARILLNSKSARFPEGLANSSGEVGRNIMDHPFGAGAEATIPGMEDHKTFGNRPNGIYVARFRNVTDQHPKFLRGYGFQGGGSRAHWERGMRDKGFGAAFKSALLRDLGPWHVWLGGWGECLPRPDNRCTLHPTLKDRWGVPALHIQCTFGPNELELLKDMQVTAAEMLEAAGARDIRTFNDELAPGLCIHEMGTARMGRDPKTSVLNGWNQAHDVPNVFVTDGACMASSGNQNPSITYMALTARACDYAVGQLKSGSL